MKNTGTLKVSMIGDQEIMMERVFNAPRELVFDALTQPEHLRCWFGPRGWSLTSCDVELAPGGNWKYVVRRTDGAELQMQGAYHLIEKPERLVYSEMYENDAIGDLLVTTVLSEDGGATKLTSTLLHQSKAVRDANNQMEHGAAESFDKLAEYLVDLV